MQAVWRCQEGESDGRMMSWWCRCRGWVTSASVQGEGQVRADSAGGVQSAESAATSQVPASPDPDRLCLSLSRVGGCAPRREITLLQPALALSVIVCECPWSRACVLAQLKC
jgi:hypothetical protein